MNPCRSDKMTNRIALLFILPLALLMASSVIGCGEPAPEIVEETDEYSYDAIMAQIAAEEADEESQ